VLGPVRADVRVRGERCLTLRVRHVESSQLQPFGGRLENVARDGAVRNMRGFPSFDELVVAPSLELVTKDRFPSWPRFNGGLHLPSWRKCIDPREQDFRSHRGEDQSHEP
jgi:hypothetical protein